jgi:hypothetical protein
MEERNQQVNPDERDQSAVGNAFHRGLLDDTRFWPYAMTEIQVRALWSESKLRLSTD